MESPADLASTALESMHLSETLDAAPTPPPTTINDLPNETLNRIFELIAEPIALRAGWDLARAAVDTLLSASLVSKRWQDLAGRVLEQNCCVVLPFSESQIESYTSRTRLPATNMIIQARSKASLIGATRGLANFRGVKSLHVHCKFLPVVMDENSPSFHGLRDLTLWGLGDKDVEFGGTPIIPRALALRNIYLDPAATKWGALLLQSAKSTLVDLGICAFSDDDHFLPRCDFDRVRNLTIALSTNRPPRWLSSETEEGATGLAGFSAIRSLKLYLYGNSQLQDSNPILAPQPVLWNFSREMFDETIATLPPTARLSQLSLPNGKLSTLDNLTPFLDEPHLHHLRELLLPNISRTLLDQRGFGRKLLAACEERGVRVVFQEELALLRTVM